MSANLVGVNIDGFQDLPEHHYEEEGEDEDDDDGDADADGDSDDDDNDDCNDIAPLQDQEQVSAEHIHCQRGNSANRQSSVGQLGNLLTTTAGYCCCRYGGGSSTGPDTVGVVGEEVGRCW